MEKKKKKVECDGLKIRIELKFSIAKLDVSRDREKLLSTQNPIPSQAIDQV